MFKTQACFLNSNECGFKDNLEADVCVKQRIPPFLQQQEWSDLLFIYLFLLQSSLFLRSFKKMSWVRGFTVGLPDFRTKRTLNNEN